MRRLLARQPLAWTTPPGHGPTLRRALGWPALTAIGLGTMLGGIFPTIGAGAHAAGPAVIVAYAFSGLVSVCVALCYAEFASMVPVAGSAYTYAYATLGEFIAWVIGWDLILEYGLSVAPTASSWSDYFQHLFGNLGWHLPQWLQSGNAFGAHPQFDVIAALITVFIAVLVAVGIRESAGVNAALVLFQIFTMLVFFGAVVSALRGANLQPFAPHGWHGVLTGTALVFFAYIGFDTVTVASEEARNPVRDVPIGILLSLVVGVVLYMGLAFFTVAAMPAAQAERRRGDARCGRCRACAASGILDCGAGRRGRKYDGDGHLAARANSHLLRHGARSNASAGRRAHSSAISHAGRHDHADRNDRRDLGGDAPAFGAA